jgi:hypothetical protein
VYLEPPDPSVESFYIGRILEINAETQMAQIAWFYRPKDIHPNGFRKSKVSLSQLLLESRLLLASMSTDWTPYVTSKRLKLACVV